MTFAQWLNRQLDRQDEVGMFAVAWSRSVDPPNLNSLDSILHWVGRCNFASHDAVALGASDAWGEYHEHQGNLLDDALAEQHRMNLALGLQEFTRDAKWNF